MSDFTFRLYFLCVVAFFVAQVVIFFVRKADDFGEDLFWGFFINAVAIMTPLSLLWPITTVSLIVVGLQKIKLRYMTTRSAERSV